MPELPEVETVRRGLAPVLEGNRIARADVNRPDLRIPFPPDFRQRITGQTIEALTRRAKYLLAHLSNGTVVIMHLGMSGRFTVIASEKAAAQGQSKDQGKDQEQGRRFPSARTQTAILEHTSAQSASGPHDHVVFELADGTRVVYTDPRRFGLMTLADSDNWQSHPLLAQCGIEPLGPDLTGAFLKAAFAGRNTPVKAALLNQTIIAGLGNIYVCEALFYAGISPRRKAATISRARTEKLAAAINDVLSRAIAAGGSSLKDYAHADGSLGYFQHSFAVYGRTGSPCPAPGCTGIIRRIVQSNRSTFYCPACQK